MPLIIGIRNGIDKGFTEEEIQFTNGFPFGMICMTAGVGAVMPRYGVPKKWKPQDFLDRIRITNQHCKIFMRGDEAGMPSWFNLEFVERMDEAGWTCNVGTKTTREWKNDMFAAYFDRLNREAKMEDEEE